MNIKSILYPTDFSAASRQPYRSRLFEIGVNVYVSTGEADGRGSYGYVIYVRPEEFEQAAQALEV